MPLVGRSEAEMHRAHVRNVRAVGVILARASRETRALRAVDRAARIAAAVLEAAGREMGPEVVRDAMAKVTSWGADAEVRAMVHGVVARICGPRVSARQRAIAMGCGAAVTPSIAAGRCRDRCAADAVFARRVGRIEAEARRRLGMVELGAHVSDVRRTGRNSESCATEDGEVR